MKKEIREGKGTDKENAMIKLKEEKERNSIIQFNRIFLTLMMKKIKVIMMINILMKNEIETRIKILT